MCLYEQREQDAEVSKPAVVAAAASVAPAQPSSHVAAAAPARQVITSQKKRVEIDLGALQARVLPSDAKKARK